MLDKWFSPSKHVPHFTNAFFSRSDRFNFGFSALSSVISLPEFMKSASHKEAFHHNPRDRSALGRSEAGNAASLRDPADPWPAAMSVGGAPAGSRAESGVRDGTRHAYSRISIFRLEVGFQ